MIRRSILIFTGVTVLATAVVTWAIADVLYDISLPRCASGRRAVSCGGEEGWHGASSLFSALFAFPVLFAVPASYLFLASRLVRAAKAKHRETRRAELRRHFAMALLAAVALTLPATLLLRSTL